MPLDFNPRNDFARVLDGLAAVTLRRRDGSAEAEAPRALRRPIRTREAEASQGRYTQSDATWHLPAAELASAPQPGDLIVECGGRRWTVLDVTETLLDGRWRCVARDLAVHHGLDQSIDIEVAEYAKTAGGAEEPTWRISRVGVPARIQPLEVEVRTEHQRISAAARFRVFLADELSLDERHRIRGPDGTRYRVVACRNAERIDALMEVDVVRIE